MYRKRIEIEYKQFIIVPKSLKMSKGKIASQVAHATFMALEKQGKVDGMIEKWKDSGMCVIVLECKNTEQLLSAAKYCEQWNIPNHLYIDEGLTEVDPLTPTALSTGVIPSKMHWMFSQFKLYK